MTLKISLELLWHHHCDACGKWWSVADITPMPGATVHCPHCGTQHQFPDVIGTGVEGVVMGWDSEVADWVRLGKS